MPPQENPELEAEFRKRHRSAPYPECLRRVAGSARLARSLVPLYDPIHSVHLDAELASVAMFVTCQENSCRYCYGALRTILKIIGFSEKRIGELEREVALADGKTRQVVELTRRLAESNPRPAQRERDRLKEAGLSDPAIAELVGFVIVTCFANRVATFLAIPPGLSFESLPDSLWAKLFRTLFSRQLRPRKAPPFPVPPAAGDFGELVAILGDTWPANWLSSTIEGCFQSPLLDRRMKLLLFAAAATAMECGFCRSQALALEMRAALDRYNHELRGRGLPELAFGIGIHYGAVVSGLIGSDDLLEFTVIGDIVNVASRVEGLTRLLDGDILVTEAVREKLDSRYELRDMPPTRVKGKSRPIATFAVRGRMAATA